MNDDWMKIGTVSDSTVVSIAAAEREKDYHRFLPRTLYIIHSGKFLSKILFSRLLIVDITNPRKIKQKPRLASKRAYFGRRRRDGASKSTLVKTLQRLIDVDCSPCNSFYCVGCY